MIRLDQTRYFGCRFHHLGCIWLPLTAGNADIRTPFPRSPFFFFFFIFFAAPCPISASLGPSFLSPESIRSFAHFAPSAAARHCPCRLQPASARLQAPIGLLCRRDRRCRNELIPRRLASSLLTSRTSRARPTLRIPP